MPSVCCVKARKVSTGSCSVPPCASNETWQWPPLGDMFSTYLVNSTTSGQVGQVIKQAKNGCLRINWCFLKSYNDIKHVVSQFVIHDNYRVSKNSQLQGLGLCFRTCLHADRQTRSITICWKILTHNISQRLTTSHNQWFQNIASTPVPASQSRPWSFWSMKGSFQVPKAMATKLSPTLQRKRTYRRSRRWNVRFNWCVVMVW